MCTTDAASFLFLVLADSAGICLSTNMKIHIH